MKNSKSSVLVIVLVLVLAAGLVFVFRGQKSVSEQVVRNTGQEESAVLDQIEESADPTVETTTTTPATEEQAATEVVAPAVKEGLQATDPASVQLASGELQLIEAFAFW